jgi:hypothetical protein
MLEGIQAGACICAARPLSTLMENVMNKIQGEGDYEAARRFNEAEAEFVKAGRVPDAADKAAPRSSNEKEEMERAEQRGRQRAKEEDPAVSGDAGDDTNSSES